MHKVDLIIVNWNTATLLKRCLNSLLRFTDKSKYVAIVVDNGSTDDSADLISRDFPLVKLICNKDNRGFAKANNQAIAQSNAEYVCLVNSDIEFKSDVVGSMAAFMDSNPTAVACAPALRLPDGKLQPGAGGYSYNPLHAFYYFFLLSNICPRLFKGIMINQAPFVRRGKPIHLDWLSGACLMVRRSMIEQAGLIDETYFMYAEDVEWFDRLRHYGSVWYLPYIEVIHNHGASSRSDEIPQTFWMDSIFLYFRSRSTRFGYLIFKCTAIIGYLLRAVIYGIAGIFYRHYFKKSRIMVHFMLHAVTYVACCYKHGDGKNMMHKKYGADLGPM